jgi:hypothetical protein
MLILNNYLARGKSINNKFIFGESKLSEYFINIIFQHVRYYQFYTEI